MSDRTQRIRKTSVVSVNEVTRENIEAYCDYQNSEKAKKEKALEEKS